MRPNGPVLACCCALLAAACGTAPPANVAGLRRIAGNELIGTCGKDRGDQSRIDATIDGLREGGVYSQEQVEHHQATKERRGCA